MSVDQIVISSPVFVPQIDGNQTLKRHAGSQLVVDNDESVFHVAHLEDFIAKSTA